MLNSVRDRVTIEQMRHLQAMPLQNESGMGNGSNRRIRVLDGFVRPVLEISTAEAEGRRAWIPSSIESFSRWCQWVCRWFAFECDCKLSRLEQSTFYRSGLTAIHIPASVKSMCEKCSSGCPLLVSITFDGNSRLEEHKSELLAGKNVSSRDCSICQSKMQVAKVADPVCEDACEARKRDIRPRKTMNGGDLPHRLVSVS
jgi:hypothetical protein